MSSFETFRGRSKLATQSFHESMLRPRTCSGDENKEKSKKSSEAGSSSDHAKQKNSKDGSRYTKVSVQDLLFDVGDSADNTGENICTINNCNRKFISRESLLAHQRKAHYPPTANVCPYCFSSFSTIPNLNKHVSCNL